VKVYIISPAHPYRGGIADSGMRLAQEFQHKGHHVTMITFTLQYPNFLFPGKTQYAEGDGPKDLHIRRMINAVNPLNWIQVGNTLKKEKPDLVIVRYWLPIMAPALGTIVRQIKKNKHSQIIAIPDNIIPHEKRFGDRRLTNYFINSVDKFVTLSKGVAEDLKLFCNKPTLVLAHPIYDIFGEKIDKNIAKEQLGLDPNDKTILFFGLIRNYKGLDLLLEAMADQRVATQNIKLIIAGEFYSAPDTYETLIKKYHLDSRIIRATFFIPTDQVNLYFSAADVVAQPYKTATQSGVTQIAFHFSKPMIVTNVGGLPEVINHNKTGLVTEVNANAVADAIVQYFDENLEMSFTQGMEAEKKKYEWDYFVTHLLDFAEQ
jgi:D-inositol-3-phosphate glycosyltransferase